MKAIISFYGMVLGLVFVLAVATNGLADTPVSGIIGADTIWTPADSPYIVTGNVLVREGVTLTIEAGVDVKFESQKALQVDGGLVARGTDNSKITFTSNQPTPASGDWAYIFFSDLSNDATFDVDGNYTGGSILEYCIVEYAGGVIIDYNGAVRLSNAHPFINHCSIRNNQTSGICAWDLSGTLKIANNTITNNTSSTGGGISIIGGTAIIYGNFISDNYAEGGGSYGGGGIFTHSNTSTISNNIISNNRVSGGSFDSGGGGIYIREGTAIISSNIINNNTVTNTIEGAGGGLLIYIFSGTVTISNNIIINNVGGVGGGMCLYGGDIISNNNIIGNNIASTGGAIVGNSDIYNNSISGNSCENAVAVCSNVDNKVFKYNTVTANKATGPEPTHIVNIISHPLCNYNNIFGNNATYELWNDNTAGSADVNVENNWWGTAEESEIMIKIYDWFDDATKGFVDYTPWETAIRTDTPVSSPRGLVVSTTASNIIMNWDSNPEGDVAGYKVYWGTRAAPFFENVADVGNSLGHTITGLTLGSYYVAVTAYDFDYHSTNDNPDTIVNENQTNGNESWYAAPDGGIAIGLLKVSGRVTDKYTMTPLADIRVGCWHDDEDFWTQTQTDTNGIYEITNLPPGDVQIRAEPESYYACIGTEFELTTDVNNLDFALPPEAILSGKVLDGDTAEPAADIEITYWNNRYAVWKNYYSDADGTFTLTNLPPGIGEIKARPQVATGYAWSLPWGSNWVYLNEGEHDSERIIALQKGALVSGYIKDANGGPASGIEFDWQGRMSEGWGDVDINGHYQIRLPLGTYTIGPDEDDFGSLHPEITITDINQPVDVNDITIYSEQTGGQISGDVNNPGGYSKMGEFFIVAFETGTVIGPNTWHTIEPLGEAELEQAGPFAITALPHDANYDVYLCVISETVDEIMSLAAWDVAINVAVDTTGINLDYNSEGSTVSGKVINAEGLAVMGATVLLNDSATKNFTGFGETDPNGEYVIYNVPGGTYSAGAVHSKYLSVSTMVEVVDGAAADVNIIVMPFAGEKEGANLNGDGVVNMVDFAKLADQWREFGLLEANFNQDSSVDFADLKRVAENWLWEPIWYHD